VLIKRSINHRKRERKMSVSIEAKKNGTPALIQMIRSAVKNLRAAKPKKDAYSGTPMVQPFRGHYYPGHYGNLSAVEEARARALYWGVVR
jgi:hypothetical protein